MFYALLFPCTIPSGDARSEAEMTKSEKGRSGRDRALGFMALCREVASLLDWGKQCLF